MEQGNIAKWNIKEGQAFAAGDVLADIETDKATMAWESQDDGVMGKILKAEGSKDVPVGTVVALAVEDESELSQLDSYEVGGGGGGSGGGGGDAAQTASGGDRAKASAGGQPSSAFPPHAVWQMPALSPTMAQGNIAKWYKQVGDEVAAGDVLVDVETDKATMAWESVEEGYVAKILVQDGAQDVAVGEPAVVIVEDAELVPAFASYTSADAGTGGGGAPAPEPEAKPEKADKPKKADKGSKAEAKDGGAGKGKSAGPGKGAAPAPARRADGGRIIASPYARKLAREAGVSLDGVRASGPDGRIIAADVQAAIESGGAAPQPGAAAATDDYMAYKDVPLNQIKRVTAKRLLESKTTVPHYYLAMECQVDALMALRRQLNDALAKSGGKVSVNDFMVKAAAAALKAVPEANASWHGDFIRVYENVDISVAVQTPHGLMVPVVRDADLKGLQSISTEVRELAGKAKENKLQPHEFTGGTFAISNLGMYGVKSFSAIINPPQACIMAVGGTDTKVVRDADGNYKEVNVITVTLSCDHRVIDGAVGATWLQAFKGYVEQPQTLLL